MSTEPRTLHFADFEKDPSVQFGMDNYETLVRISNFIKKLRTSSEMSQTALFERSGISQADISRMESGSMERGPSVLTLARLAHAAGKVLVLGIAEPDGKGGITQAVEL